MSIGPKVFRRALRRRLVNAAFGVMVGAFLVSPAGSVSPGTFSIEPFSVAAAGEAIELAPAPVVPVSELAPTANQPARAGARAVNTADRAAVVNLFNTVYTPALAVPASWTGSLLGCIEGTVSDAYQTATISTVNYFRAMAGVPDNVTLDTINVPGHQQAALMMAAAGVLTRTPLPNFPCYKPAGATAAASANMALGASGPQAVIAYMTGAGATNTAVGQRRWILLPTQLSMPTGSTTATNIGPNGVFTGSNALGVQGPQGPRPAGNAFAAWPPQGFVPYQVVYPRWSFSIPDANFTSATVTMTQAGTAVTVLPLAVQPTFGSGTAIGDNTLVWEPQITTTAPTTDKTYTVNITNVLVNGVAQNFTYNVTVIDPAVAGGGGSIGGKGLGISTSAAGVQLTWNSGTGQTGYGVIRLAGGALTLLTAGLSATATSFVDAAPLPGLNCYAVGPLGTNPQQFSDALCAAVGTGVAAGAPQNFTMRLNQSTTAAFTWSPPAGAPQTGYILAKLGGANQPLGPTIVSTLGSTNGPTCFQLQTTVNGVVTGSTDFLCGIPGFATLNP